MRSVPGHHVQSKVRPADDKSVDSALLTLVRILARDAARSIVAERDRTSEAGKAPKRSDRSSG
jgi:hypothetical protein